MYKIISGFGILGIVAYMAFIAVAIFFSLHGLVLAFSASIVLGIIALIFEPLPLVIGLVYWVTGTNLPQVVAASLGW